MKNRSLLGGDFKSGELPAGARGPQGAQGARGAQGPQGPRGSNGTNGFGLLRYPQTIGEFSNTESGVVETPCPGGTYPTGGSAWAVDTATGLVDHPEVITSQGIAFTGAGAPLGYFAVVADVSSGDVDVVVDAVCANASQVIASASGLSKRVR